jgi:hypothetical protein
MLKKGLSYRLSSSLKNYVFFASLLQILLILLLVIIVTAEQPIRAASLSCMQSFIILVNYQSTNRASVAE